MTSVVIAPGRGRDRAGGRRGRDRRLDLGVGRGRELGAVGEVDLVAVVGGRVVRGGDLDARHGAEVPHGEREHRRGERGGQHVDGEPGAREHLGGGRGEGVGAVPGVAPDHDRAALPAAGEPRGEPGGGAAHDGDVHPRRPRPHRPAQPGRAEAQRARHAVGELVRGAGGARHRARQHAGELVARRGVGVVGDPPGGGVAGRAGRQHGRPVPAAAPPSGPPKRRPRPAPRGGRAARR